MVTERALLHLANIFAEGLRAPHAPTACPGCLVIYSDELKPDSAATLFVQTKCHEFLDCLMAFVSAGWTDEKRSSASDMLRRSHFRCRRCNPSRRTLEEDGITGSVFDFAFVVVIQILGTCLSACRARREKGFGSKRGRWPTSAEQLFPGGAERTMGALVGLLRTNSEVASIIVLLITVHRPLAFSALLTAENRARIIGVVISRAAEALQAVYVDTSKLRQPVLAPVRDAIARRHIEICHIYVLMLYAICFGPDSKLLAKVHFLYHREADLFVALDPLVRLLEQPERTHGHVTYMTGYLWSATSQPLRKELGCLEAPPYAKELESQSSAMLKDPYQALRHYLARQTTRRDCQGPDCGKRVHEKATPGAFSLCAKCRTVQYCSKECQKADWTDERFPHKEICDMLQELFTFTRMDMDRHQFADACRTHGFPLERVDRIIEWATNGAESHDYAHGATFLHRSLEPGITAGELYGVDPAYYKSSLLVRVLPNNDSRRTPVTQEEVAKAVSLLVRQVEAGTLQDPDFAEIHRPKDS